MIQINDLSYKIGDKKILDSVCLKIDKGITAIIGPNGSGKTTLLKAIEGLIEFKEGEVLIDGEKQDKKTRKERALMMTYFPQFRPVPQIEAELLIEHGRFPYTGFQKKMSEKDQEAIQKAIESTDTYALVNKKVSRLSGGERQKIYIATALAQDTDIILFDEPTTYLDLSYQLEVLEIIKSLKSEGKTIVVVLHDLIEAFSLSDQIVLMNDGKIISIGTPESMIVSGIIKDVFHSSLVKDDDSNSVFKYKLIK
ncbi:MAG: ABC transporter ATP-binding protein [Bacillales bacterium]|nr:ABC transporter ATP-binding protein [Bacillales bacterium]